MGSLLPPSQQGASICLMLSSTHLLSNFRIYLYSPTCKMTPVPLTLPALSGESFPVSGTGLASDPLISVLNPSRRQNRTIPETSGRAGGLLDLLTEGSLTAPVLKLAGKAATRPAPDASKTESESPAAWPSPHPLPMELSLCCSHSPRGNSVKPA